VASITVAAPLDTIKTRIQNANFEQKMRGVTIVRELLRDEGAMALFKGLTPKVGQKIPSPIGLLCIR
jgi:Mitochondrial carrier protein